MKHSNDNVPDKPKSATRQNAILLAAGIALFVPLFILMLTSIVAEAQQATQQRNEAENEADTQVYRDTLSSHMEQLKYCNEQPIRARCMDDFIKDFTAEYNFETNTPITSIYWSDGDSGRINGNFKFRLANIDAPETGGVGAYGGAKCEAERVQGYEVKAFIVKFTKDAELTISKMHGMDKYMRQVIDLSANGVDVGQAGIDFEQYRAWPHKGKRALQKKPDWCK